MAAEKLCDIESDWERRCTLKRGIRSMLQLYYEILKEKKKKSKQLTLHSFLCLLNHGLGLLQQSKK